MQRRKMTLVNSQISRLYNTTKSHENKLIPEHTVTLNSPGHFLPFTILDLLVNSPP